MQQENSLRYSGNLLPIEEGHQITISGKTKESAQHLELFLAKDKGTSDDFEDIQLYVKVDFTGIGSITRSYYTKGVGWEEEKEGNLMPNDQPIPIKRGGVFKISIYADVDMFFMSIDGRPYCTFKFRKPLSDIRRINIYGDVDQIYRVDHKIVKPKESLEGFCGSIPVIRPEMAIVFTGTCHGTPSGTENEHFTITLTDSDTGKILLRAIHNLDTKEIVAVAQTDSETFDQEVIEKPSPFPLQDTGRFKAAIGVTHHKFVVTANGQQILKFPFECDSFFGHPVSYKVTMCEGLDMTIQGVDVFLMAPGCDFKEVSDVPTKMDFNSANRNLAHIYHH